MDKKSKVKEQIVDLIRKINNEIVELLILGINNQNITELKDIQKNCLFRIKLLLSIRGELIKMKTHLSPKLFIPYYPKAFVDYYGEKITDFENELFKLAEEYIKLD